MLSTDCPNHYVLLFFILRRIKIKIISYVSDLGGCYFFRIFRPGESLKRFGVTSHWSPTLPSEEGVPGPSLNALCKQIADYDLVIVQRSTNLEILRFVKNACHLMSKPLVYDTDDDYLNLPPTNPCYYGTALEGLHVDYEKLIKTGQGDRAKALLPLLEQSRLEGIEAYKKVLTLPDLITTTTEELAQTIRPHNKNIVVIPNCVEQVYNQRDYIWEEMDENGFLKHMDKLGMGTIPAYWFQHDQAGQRVGQPNRILRIGYTGTTSHRDDFVTIEHYWNRLIEKYANKVWFVYIGDQYFFEKHQAHRGRRHYIRNTEYSLYKQNIRNLDIGIAPLLPNPFNMGKSELKALEYGMWGACPVLPRYITYTRSFKDKETCMMYSNGREFYEVMEYLINHPEEVFQIGRAARDWVANNRLEDPWAEKRYKLYKQVIDSKPKMKCMTPNNRKVKSG